MSVRLDEIDLSSHDAFVEEVPLWAFRELRERDPVHWQPEPTPSKGFWAITRFRDIEEILRDTKTFSSAHGVTLEEQDDEEVEARASMIDMDPRTIRGCGGSLRSCSRGARWPSTRASSASRPGSCSTAACLRASSTSSRRSRGAPDPRPGADHGGPRRGPPACASSWATR